LTPVYTALYAWGYNGNGHLGLNDISNRSSPVQVGSLTNWNNITGGYYGAFATKVDGTLWGTGYNLGGYVGDNTTISRSSPVQIGALTTWDKVTTAVSFSFAIKTDNTLWVVILLEKWGRELLLTTLLSHPSWRSR
jgi:alpha-tubulin suppressor-like RCC1 family protein